MKKTLRNYAFIDCHNVHLAIVEAGWKLDWKEFRIYLEEKHGVAVAYIFLGYVESNRRMYSYLNRCGYSLVLKEVVEQKGKIKGNVDAELVLQAMIDRDRYDQAVLVSSDGDYSCLVKYLNGLNKLRKVISPTRASCSHLLSKASGARIDYIEDFRDWLESVRE